MSKVSARGKKTTLIKSHERGAKVKFIDDVVVIKNRRTIKFVVDIFEKDFETCRNQKKQLVVPFPTRVGLEEVSIFLLD